MKDLRIIFMGTPEFAVESLTALLASGQKVVGVITAPDKPKGRGQQLSFSPVKEYAVSKNIPVLQPTNLKSPEFLEELKAYRANLFVVVAFRMLPEVVWSLPEFGTFNLHASLLPQYRGAAPINWAVINGEKETGVTTFFIKHEIDTGSVIFQEKETIHDHDTVGMVYERLMEKGAKLVVKTVEAIKTDNYQLSLQHDDGNLKHAPKIFKEDCKINWSKKAEEIRNLVRGLNPYPAAWTEINGQHFKIFEVAVTGEKPIGKPGDMITDQKNYFKINAVDEVLEITDLQLQGKKRMKTKDFLRGHKI